MEKKFNKAKYDMEYRKKHKAQFSVDLSKEEKEEMDHLLKDKDIKKVSFIRNAFQNLKQHNNLEKESLYRELFIIHDIIILLSREENDKYLNGILSAKDIYMSLRCLWDDLSLEEINNYLNQMIDKKLINCSENLFSLNHNTIS